MKIILFFTFILLLGLVACHLPTKGKSINITKNSTPKKTNSLNIIAPFVKESLEEARKKAFQKRPNKKTSNRQFIAVIIDEKADKKDIIYKMGFRKKDESRWEKTYYPILLKSNEKDAQKLIKQYYIQAFPVIIKESISIDGAEIFPTIWYGSMPQVSEKSQINIHLIAQKLHQQYQSGDRDKRLLLQLRDHTKYLKWNPKATRDLDFQLTDDYLKQFSKSELSTYKGYRMLKKEAKDVRYEVVQKLLKDRAYYNTTFLELAKAQGDKKSNWFDADWIIRQAIQNSFDQAADYSDKGLYEKAMVVKEQLEPNFMNPFIAKSILKYQLKQGDLKTIKTTAIQYFNTNKNWYYSRDYDLMEGGAKAVNQLSKNIKEWEQAEKWIARAGEKHPNPTRFRLQAELLQKLGNTTKRAAILHKIKAYEMEFSVFKNLFPISLAPISYKLENVSAAEYKRITSLPSKYKIFYKYISKEGSIYKKGEKIEPIAIVKESNTEVELLTRVHLVTGSILPVTHYRSYYIKSRFKKDGEHLESVYMSG